MLNEKVAELMNDQINKEFYSSYLYLDMSNYYVTKIWTDLPTGLRFRHRKKETMRFYLWSISRQIAASNTGGSGKTDKRFEEPADPLKQHWSMSSMLRL